MFHNLYIIIQCVYLTLHVFIHPYSQFFTNPSVKKNGVSPKLHWDFIKMVSFRSKGNNEMINKVIMSSKLRQDMVETSFQDRYAYLTNIKTSPRYRFKIDGTPFNYRWIIVWDSIKDRLNVIKPSLVIVMVVLDHHIDGAWLSLKVQLVIISFTLYVFSIATL